MKIKQSETMNVLDSILDVVKRLLSREKGPEITVELKDDGYRFHGKNGTVHVWYQNQFQIAYITVDNIKLTPTTHTYNKYDIIVEPKVNMMNRGSDSVMEGYRKFYDQPVIKTLVEELKKLN